MIPGRGTKIPHATRLGQKKKKKDKTQTDPALLLTMNFPCLSFFIHKMGVKIAPQRVVVRTK